MFTDMVRVSLGLGSPVLTDSPSHLLVCLVTFQVNIQRPEHTNYTYSADHRVGYLLVPGLVLWYRVTVRIRASVMLGLVYGLGIGLGCRVSLRVMIRVRVTGTSRQSQGLTRSAK